MLILKSKFNKKRKKMFNSFIIDSIRTPIGKWGGSLSSIRTDDLATLTIKELLNRNPNIPKSEIEDVMLGCSNQAGEDNRNVARMAVLLADLPVSVAGETVNRLCGSGLSAVINANRAIKLNEGEILIAGGVESMTRAPYVMSKSNQAFGRDTQIYDSSIGWRFPNKKIISNYGNEGMGETAENLAEKHSISRIAQDKFALWSQEKAEKAKNSGRLSKEIMPVKIAQRKKEDLIFEHDEFIRENSKLESLEKLKPAFRENGTVTAGNSSGINDGSCAILLASGNAVAKHNLIAQSEIISSAVVGTNPSTMGEGPIEAANKALKRAKLSWNDIDIIELNEAFAAQALTCTRAWGLEDFDARLNPNGGAIALGHPLGMSGARLIQSASIELREQNKEFALISLCIGVGQGIATIIKRV